MELPENTLLANKLYYPSKNEITNRYELLNKTAKAGIWQAALPQKYNRYYQLSFTDVNKFTNNSNQELLCGKLKKLNEVFKAKIPFTKYILFRIASQEEIKISELLEEKLIEKTNYIEFFESQNFYKLHQELRQIPTQYQEIYKITKKGDGIVFLDQDENGIITPTNKQITKDSNSSPEIWLPEATRI